MFTIIGSLITFSKSHVSIKYARAAAVLHACLPPELEHNFLSYAIAIAYQIPLLTSRNGLNTSEGYFNGSIDDPNKRTSQR